MTNNWTINLKNGEVMASDGLQHHRKKKVQAVFL
jgi:hypothetical protein